MKQIEGNRLEEQEFQSERIRRAGDASIKLNIFRKQQAASANTIAAAVA